MGVQVRDESLVVGRVAGKVAPDVRPDVVVCWGAEKEADDLVVEERG